MQNIQRKSLANKIWLIVTLIFLCTCKTVYAQSTNNYTDYATQQKSNEVQVIAPYQAEVSALSQHALQNAQGPALQQFMQTLVQNKNTTNSMQPSSPQAKILIFVSSSMPQVSLQQWFNEALQINAPVIIRGLVNNSFAQTKAWAKIFIDGAKGKGGIQIDPVAFEIFNIQQVPAVVITQQSPQCYPNQSCIAPPFDVVYGNVTLKTALQDIADNGDTGKSIAQQMLKTLGEDNA